MKINAQCMKKGGESGSQLAKMDTTQDLAFIVATFYIAQTGTGREFSVPCPNLCP